MEQGGRKGFIVEWSRSFLSHCRSSTVFITSLTDGSASKVEEGRND